jgi:hypothetical protein
MPTFEIVEAKAWHCGAMSRALRLEHQKAVAMIGLNSHRELRGMFDESIFRKAWLIDGRLAAVGGVTGPQVSSYGIVWLAFSSAATKYPMAMVKEARRQIEFIMQTKRLLISSILDGDDASERFAIFLGFVPAKEVDHTLPAETRYGRIEIARKLKEIEEVRVPLGTGYVKLMAYRHLGAE